MSDSSGETRQSRRLGLFAAIVLAGIVAGWPTSMEPTAQRLAAVTVGMAILWLTQAVHISVTALVPLAALPLLGIVSAKAVSKSYMNQNIMLFMGGFIIALGIERWGLHRRIALHIVSRVGSGLRRTVFGFMLATWFLSMWISNTASTLMMMPIGLALVASLREVLIGSEKTTPDANSSTDLETAEVDRILTRFATVLMLAIAYSASIGGLCTLVGTLPNVVFAEQWATNFPEADPVAAGQWMVAVVPLGTILLLTAWGVLTVTLKELPTTSRFERTFFRDEIRKLGPMTPAERRMLIVFAVTALLWVFRKPIPLGSVTVPGWQSLIEIWFAHLGVSAESAKGMLHDSTVGVGMALLMFVIPCGLPDKPEAALMDWPTAERLPWGILLLVGGGLALADAFQSTGLSLWMGTTFAEAIEGSPDSVIIIGLCLLVTFLTELTSNTATTSTLLPILANVAGPLGIDPILIMFPATLSASCAFMLPVATPPNAIVFGSGRVTMRQMMGYGVVLNLLAAFWVALASLYWIGPRLGG